MRVEADRVSMCVVPNADYARRFAEELNYWETKVAEKTEPAEKRISLALAISNKSLDRGGAGSYAFKSLE